MTDKRRVTGYIPIDVHDRLKAFADSHYPKLSESTAVALLLSIALDPDRSTTTVPTAGNTLISDEGIDRLGDRVEAIEATLKKLSCDITSQHDTDKKIEAIETRLEDMGKTLLQIQDEASIARRLRKSQSETVEAIDPSPTVATYKPAPRKDSADVEIPKVPSIDEGGAVNDTVLESLPGKDSAPIAATTGKEVVDNYPPSGEVSEPAITPLQVGDSVAPTATSKPAPEKDFPVGEVSIGGVSVGKSKRERKSKPVSESEGKTSQRSLSPEDRIALLESIPGGERRSKKAIGETMKYSSPIPMMNTIEKADPVKNPGNYKIRVALDRMFSIERIPKGTGESGQELIYYTRIDGATAAP